MIDRFAREAGSQSGSLLEVVDRVPVGIAVFDAEARLRFCNQAWAQLAARLRSGAGAPVPPSSEVTPGTRLLDLLPGVGKAVAPLLEQVLAGGVVREEALPVEQATGVAYLEMALTPALADGKVVGFVNAAFDVSARVLAHKALEREVADQVRETERRRQVAESLRDILETLNSGRPLADILDAILTQAANLLGADAVGILRFDERADLLRMEAARGFDPAFVSRLSIPLGWGRARSAVADRQPVVLSDVGQALRQEEALARDPARRNLLAQVAKRYPSLLVVPLVPKGRLFGSIVLYFSQRHEFAPEEVRLASAFGDQAALAIENARLFAEAQGKAVLEERQRLARELHDSVTQSLYSLTLLAEAARLLAEQSDLKRVGEYLERLGHVSQQALKEMRLLVYELRPLALEHVGLVGAVQQRLDAVEKRAGMEAHLLAAREPDWPPAVEEGLYRIVQEALNNALKHAHASSVTVRIEGDEAQAVVEVRDNGRGFDPEALEDSGGMGLSNIRQRVAALGGSLTIQSAPGQGTLVAVVLRLDEAQTSQRGGQDG